MSGPIAYHCQQLIAAEEVAIAPDDAGFLWGATVSERLRTFSGRPYCVAEHLARLRRSLELIQLDPPPELGLPGKPENERVADLLERIAGHNRSLLAEGAELDISLLVSPGPASAWLAGHPRPSLTVMAVELNLGRWAQAYQQGLPLVTSQVAQVPAASWSPQLKCRSRVHYFLADQQARQRDPRAVALLVDQQGNVGETSLANVLAYRHGIGLVSPPRTEILPGISLAMVEQLAGQLDLAWQERPLPLDELRQADEVWLASTPFCLLPVTRLDGEPIGQGAVGEVYRRVLAAWSHQVGCDIAGQAARAGEPG